MLGSAAARPVERAPHRPQPSRSTETITRRHADVIPLRGRMVDDSLHRPGGRVPQPRQPSAQTEDCHPAELNLLGGFRLLVAGAPAQVGRTGQRLLAVLACRGRQATRTQVAHALWPDTTSARAHANLRTALYRLCRSTPDVVQVSTTYLRLGADLRIDLEQSTRLANRIVGNDVAADDNLFHDALRANLYDDLLPDWDDEWLADHQYRHRQLRLTALETLSSHLAAAGHYGAAVQTALAAVQADSLRDSAHQTLIRACLAQGNRHEAYTHYTTYRRILRDELGLDPPPYIGQLLSSA